MKIPLYNQRVQPPPAIQAPSLSPAVAGEAYRGLASFGKDLEDLGFQIQEEKDAILRTGEFTDRMVKAEKEISSLQVNIENERNPRTASTEYEKGFQAISERAMDGVNDSKVLDALTRHLGTRERESSSKMKHLAYKWTVEDAQVKAVEDLEEMQRNASAPGATEIEWQNNYELAADYLNNLETLGVFSPEKLHKLRLETHKGFYVKGWNRFIEQGTAFQNLDWLQNIGDATVEADLLRKADVASTREQTKKDREFKERSGNILNRYLLDIRSGRMDRDNVNEIVGSGVLTDEHERILIHDMDQVELGTTKGLRSDPERLAYWQSEIEYAGLRKNEASLRAFADRIREDPKISSTDGAKLLGTIQIKLGKVDSEDTTFKEGYSQAVNVLDRYFGYSPMTGIFASPKNNQIHRGYMRRIQEASQGWHKDPTTGKKTPIPKLSGGDLVDFAYKLIEEYEKSLAQDEQSAGQNELYKDIKPRKE